MKFLGLLVLMGGLVFMMAPEKSYAQASPSQQAEFNHYNNLANAALARANAALAAGNRAAANRFADQSARYRNQAMRAISSGSSSNSGSTSGNSSGNSGNSTEDGSGRGGSSMCQRACGNDRNS